MFRRVLIANRGEIAVRIAATLQQMGITAVAVYSDPDRRAMHVRAADEAYPLGGSTSAESYLQIDKIIDIAKSRGIDAIHPGYGFLSENDDFAQACGDSKIAFIGPTPRVIREMGDKIIAKSKFRAAGVPVVPGWTGQHEGDPNMEEVRRQAESIGYPVLIKAAAGGGGKGMRIVQDEADLPAALDSAQREAHSAFSDGRVFLEKYIARPRHVEFQIFGDQHGNLVHLFERECSIQRRHQKIIEESPSPALTPALRQKMGDAAVKAAKAIGYTNAGTVEFILDEKGDFYFLEVNTRLQVEHPVTEMITQQDLVRAQVMVAAGEPLPFRQEQLQSTGHAIECRVYAEDPARNFMPSIGTLVAYAPPVGPNIRVDTGVGEGSEISVHYDPMLAKLICWGADRNESIARMLWALERYAILGVTTNLDYLRAILNHQDFAEGRIDTHFLEEHELQAGTHDSLPEDALLVAALMAGGATVPAGVESARADGTDPWRTAGRWRSLL